MAHQTTKVNLRQRRLIPSEVVKLRREFATDLPDGWKLYCALCGTWSRAKAMEYGVTVAQIIMCVRQISWADKK